MKQKYILLSLLALTFISCGKKINYTGVDSFAFEELGTELFNDSFLFSFPVIVGVNDSLLVVADRVNGKYLHLFDKSSGEHKASLANIGRGEGEVTGPDGEYMKNDSLICVFDWNNQRLVTYNINAFLRGEKEHFTQVSFLNDTFRADWAIPLDEGYFVGGDNVVRFAFFDNEGKLISTYEKYPEMGIKDTETVWSICNYFTPIEIDQNSKRIVFGTYVGYIMETYSYEGYQLELLDQKFIYEPIYTYAQGAKPKCVALDYDSITGIEGMRLHDNGIYVSMCGVDEETLMENPETMFIKYDWGLNVIEGYKVKGFMKNFVIDSDNTVFAGFYDIEDDSFYIRKFKL